MPQNLGNLSSNGPGLEKMRDYRDGDSDRCADYSKLQPSRQYSTDDRP